jgi:hypothetical protein
MTSRRIMDIVRVVEFDTAGQLREVWYNLTPSSGEDHLVEVGSVVIYAVPIGDTQQGFKLNMQRGSLVGFKIYSESDIYTAQLSEEDQEVVGYTDIYEVYESIAINESVNIFNITNPYVAKDSEYLFLEIDNHNQAASHIDQLDLRLFINKMASPYVNNNFRRT